MASHPPGEASFLAMTVNNLGFLLDRLGEDCHPLQFLRELTKNSIEAIIRSGGEGEIRWDTDWTQLELEGTRKICIIDNGDGMTGEEMVRLINQLSSSIAEQSLSGNYGVGAKIAAATRNPQGVVYLSWKNGEGSMIRLIRDVETGQYGLEQFRRADDTYGHYLSIEDDVKPEGIGENGTMVVLHGKSVEDDTMRPPEGAASPSRWVSKYLNMRFFRIPEGIRIRAREGWEYERSDVDRNVLRKLTGQSAYLSAHAKEKGTLSLKGAEAHWWILKEEPALTNNSGFVESSGHVAALYQDELYEYATGRSGTSLLQQCGITFGHRQVVIYLEPNVDGKATITTNTSRTALLMNKEQLPWSDWAEEFRVNLPEPLEEFVAEKAAAAENTDHAKAIRDRLKELMALFKISRYKVTRGGMVEIDPDSFVAGGASGRNSQTRTGQSRGTRDGGGTGGNVYAVFEKKDSGVAGHTVNPDPWPDVVWVSVANGTREQGDMEDRAAKYLQEQNKLFINADFRVFNDAIEYFTKQAGDSKVVGEVVREAVHTWFEQALIETVIGLQQFRHSKTWTVDDVNLALSEEGLTAATMQRYHINFAVRREVGAKLGSTRKSKPKQVSAA